MNNEVRGLDDTIAGIRLQDVIKLWGCDGTINDNANLDYHNPETIHKHIADMTSKDALMKILPEHIVNAHKFGDIHIHDAEYFATRIFCFDTDLRYILYYGLYPDGTGARMPVARPAKSPEVAILHAAKSLGSSQCCCAGGQGFFNFNIFLAPYISKVRGYKKTKQLAQMFVYEMSQMMVARGAQAVFSSVQLWPGVPKLWRNVPAIYCGKKLDDTYGDFEDDAMRFFEAMMDVLKEGDARGRPFSFPKPEIAISKEMWSNPEYRDLYDRAIELALLNGSAYFDLSDREDAVKCSQCCAYQFMESPDTDMVRFNNMLNFNNAHFGAMGSIQVISVNMPRLAYKCGGDFSLLYDELTKLYNIIFETFMIKKRYISNAPLPYLRQSHAGDPLAYIDDMGYVIGVVGVNEFARAITGKDMHESEESLGAALRVIGMMNLMAGKYGAKYGIRVSVARTPAETTAQKFAVADLIRYKDMAIHNVKGDIQTAMSKIRETHDLPVYYSNGTHLPVDAAVSMKKKVEIETKFFTALRAGNIFHIWCSDISPFITVLEEMKIYKEEIDRAREVFDCIIDSGINYFTLTRDLSTCLNCNTTYSTVVDKCPKCDSTRIEIFSRITGYISPLSAWNVAKQQEFRDRVRWRM